MEKSKQQPPKLLELIQQDEGLQKLAQNLEQGAAGALRGLTADVLGAPVDLVNEVLRPVGLSSDKPVLGSKFIREKAGMPLHESGAAEIGNLLSSLAAPEKIPAALGGIMIGAGAKTWNKGMAELASDAIIDGVSPEKVWRTTGTFVSPGDRMLRQEIPDATSGFIRGRLPSDAVIDGALKGKPVKLSKIFNHPQLYEAYPELKDINFMMNTATNGAFYRHNSKLIEVGTKVPGLDKVRKLHGDEYANRLREAWIRNSTLHELQHAVQRTEGFAPGGSSERLYDLKAQDFVQKHNRAPNEEEDRKLVDSAIDEYERLAGEAEARLIEARKDLTSIERRDNYPAAESFYGYDLPLDKLIRN